jgi:hypothetical protein
MLCTEIAFAQEKIVVTTTEDGEWLTKVFGRPGRSSHVFYCKGNPFLYPTYERGSFTIDGGQTYACPVMFNLLINELLAQIADTTVVLRSKSFTLKDNLYVVMHDYCYQVLWKQNITLLRKFDVFIKPWWGPGRFDGEIFVGAKYYVLSEENKLRHIELTKSSLRKVMNLSKDDSLLATLPKEFDEQILIHFLEKLYAE